MATINLIDLRARMFAENIGVPEQPGKTTKGTACTR
jgi:predicted PhzF superfamily epimerase YddE/YHI9